MSRAGPGVISGSGVATGILGLPPLPCYHCSPYFLAATRCRESVLYASRFVAGSGRDEGASEGISGAR